MKELSLNILDISENSTKAKATLVEILLEETDDTLTITVKDNGTGMTDDILNGVTDPFCTTRTTRKVGMGIPLFKFAAEQTGGSLKIESKHFSSFPDDHGTTVTAHFYKNHIDFTPLGDLPSTVTTLIQGHPDVDFVFYHKTVSGEVSLDTRELREVLEDVPLDSFEILIWIKDSLIEQYDSI
jgi:hypothetical protein